MDPTYLHLWRVQKRDVTGEGPRDLLWSKRLTGLASLNYKVQDTGIFQQ